MAISWGLVIPLWLIAVWSMQDWLGAFWGTLVSIVFVPGILVFPLIHWLVEGYWPETYLWIYGAALVCSLAWQFVDRR